MKRRVTAMILAALAVNPFCCCLGKSSSSTESGHRATCCGGAVTGPVSGEMPAPPDHDPEPCDCESSQRRQAPLPEGPSFEGGTRWHLLGTLVWITSATGLPGPGDLDRADGTDRPEAALRTGGRTISRVHCVYLI